MASTFAKATVKIRDFQSERSINLEDETTYVCKVSYGIIVIDDTLRKVKGTLVGTYSDDMLTLVCNGSSIDLEVGLSAKSLELKAYVLTLKTSPASAGIPQISVYHVE